jgi:hypothetical protein
MPESFHALIAASLFLLDGVGEMSGFHCQKGDTHKTGTPFMPTKASLRKDGQKEWSLPKQTPLACREVELSGLCLFLCLGLGFRTFLPCALASGLRHFPLFCEARGSQEPMAAPYITGRGPQVHSPSALSRLNFSEA